MGSKDYQVFQANGSKHEPRHRYDCERCKFSWCCGPTCACILTRNKSIPQAPEERLVEVARLTLGIQKDPSITFEQCLEHVRKE